jgi:EcoRII C terminal
MGYSLQNQLAALFDSQKLKYEAQATTEAQNKPDFIFPGSASSTIPDSTPHFW